MPCRVFNWNVCLGGGDDEEEQNQAQNEETPASGDEEQNNTEQNDETTEETNETDSEEQESNSEETTEEESEEENQDEETDVEVKPGDSEEVKEVREGNWEPYPTEQSEPHSINLESGSQDRIEIESAIAKAVNSSSNNLTYWWLESGGVPDQVTGYVEDKSSGEYYRVPLKWIENEGWQPQKVEVLYENIGKQKLEGN